MAMEGAPESRTANSHGQRRKPFSTMPEMTMRISSKGRGAIPRQSIATVQAEGRSNAPVQEEYISSETYTRLVDKLSTLEGQNSALSNALCQQKHEIETLRDLDSRKNVGNDHLYAKIAQLEEELGRAGTQMNELYQDRDGWRENYIAEVDQKNMKQATRPDIRKSEAAQGYWSKMYQAARLAMQSEADVHNRLEKKYYDLKQSYFQLQEYCQQQEHHYEKFMKQANGKADQLMAHCSSLAKQSGVRKTHVPLEDQGEVLDAFRQLHVAIRNWAFDAWELKSEDRDVRFTSTPLARHDDVDFTTSDPWILVACTWELLLKYVFGISYRITTGNIVRHLWLKEETAQQYAAVEKAIASCQKPDILHEWRSFTTQCLYRNDWHETSGERVEVVIQKILGWVLPLLHRNQDESEEVVKFVADLRNEVVQPAISFAAMLSKRYVPILIGTPLTVDSAVRRWTGNQDAKDNELKIVIMPEVLKIDAENDPDFRQTVVLSPAEWFQLDDLNDCSASESEEDEEEL